MLEGNQNSLTETVFSFFSLKVKMIIIGICLGGLILFIGIFALIGTFSGNSDSEDEETGKSSNTGQVSDSTYTYKGAKLSMPFEVWDSTRDVITSKFSHSRTVTVNRCNTDESTYSE